MEKHPKTHLHDTISDLLDEGEIAIGWIVIVDVAGPDGARYLSHRDGGGVDGTDPPTPWNAVGMLQAASAVSADKMLTVTYNEQDPDEDFDGD